MALRKATKNGQYQ